MSEEEKTESITKREVGSDNNSSKEANTKTFLDTLINVSDDVLTNFPMPKSEKSEKSEVDNICTNSVFKQLYNKLYR